jgi:hypothetical protein
MAAAIEEIRVDGEIEEALPAELQFLRQANTNDIIGWLGKNASKESAQCMFPKVWHLLEKRIREHPHEAREVDEGNGRLHLPIHDVLWYSGEMKTNFHAAPLSLIQLLIEVHPDGLHVQDDNGRVPLHFAVNHPCIDCFRAVLYNGSVDATTIQASFGWTPLHKSIAPNVSLVTMLELLHFNRDCITIQGSDGRTALDILEYLYAEHVKAVFLKLVKNYNHVPKVPNDATITILESHPVLTVLAPRLEPGCDAFILQPSLGSKVPACPC